MPELAVLKTANHRPSFRPQWINVPIDGWACHPNDSSSPAEFPPQVNQCTNRWPRLPPPPPLSAFSLFLSAVCRLISSQFLAKWNPEENARSPSPFLLSLPPPPPRQTNHTRKKVKKKAAGWNPKNGRRPANWISTPLAPEYYPTGDLICPTWFQLRFVSSIWHLGAAARHQLLINSTRNQSRPR